MEDRSTGLRKRKKQNDDCISDDESTRLISTDDNTPNAALSYEPLFKLIAYRHIVIFASAMLIYSNVNHGQFLHDDIVAIVRNRDVVGNTSLTNLFKNDFWGTDIVNKKSHKSYRPLCVLTFRLNYYLHGLQPLYFHLVNCVTHALVSVLTSVVSHKVIYCRYGDRGKNLAFLVGLVFATHPIHTEAVANIVSRAELLSALFFLVAVLLHNISMKCDSRIVEVVTLSMSVLTAGCAMLMKESGITVLGLMFVIDAFNVYATFNVSKTCSTLWKIFRVVMIMAAMLSILFLRFYAMGWTKPTFSSADNPASKNPFLKTRFLTYSYISWVNFKLLLMPINLLYDYSYDTIPLVNCFSDYRSIATLAFFTISFLVVLKICRKCLLNEFLTPEAWGMLLLILPYIPCSNIFFPVGFVVAERTLYLPSIGFSILMVCFIKKYIEVKSRSASHILLIALLAFYAAKTWERNKVWQTKEALFKSGMESSPHNPKIRYNWANFLRETQRYEEAVIHYEEVLKLSPDYPGALNNLAVILEKNDSTLERAKEMYTRLIRLVPDRAEAYMNLASIFNRTKDYEKAAEIYLKMMSRHIYPILPTISLAETLVRNNSLDSAESAISNLLFQFCHARRDKRVLGLLAERRAALKFNINRQSKQCLDEKALFTRSLLLYARILHSKGLFEESKTMTQSVLKLREQMDDDIGDSNENI